MNSKLRLTVLSKNPIVLYSGMYAAGGRNSEFWRLSDDLGDACITTLMLVAWSAEFKSPSAKGIVEWRKDFMNSHPKHKIVFVANTLPEYFNLKSLGSEVVFCNQNIFVDSNLFKPLDVPVEKKFNAVYNAQFLDFKRHELAKEVKELVLIGYNASHENLERVKKLLPDATYANINENSDFKWLNQTDVNIIYNQSMVGLCLSAKEGAMHASMEYLLSGLPIVTTHSIGGRDYFFDGRFVNWVSDDQDSVARAVEALVESAIDRDFIRNETLRKVDAEYARFFSCLFEIVRDVNVVENIRESWPLIFNDKLIMPKSFDNIIEQLS